jgi:hypothetical protein
MAFSRAATDPYANSVTLSSRLVRLFSAARTPDFHFAINAAVSALAIFWVFRNDAKLNPRLRTRLLQVACISSAVVLLLTTQMAFYNGDWPTGMRYDFPGMLGTPLLAIAVLDLISTAICSRWRVRPSLLLLLALTASLSGIRGGLNDVYEGSNINVARTQSTKANIAAIVSELKSSPGVPLVLESHNPIDYESLISLKVFLAHFGVTNPIYVRVHGYTAEAQRSASFRELAASGIGWSRMDESKVAQARQCYSVHFRGQDQAGCKTLATF